MFVCICNAINERQVTEAVDAGAGSALEVYAHWGCAPQCGKCLNVMGEKVLVATSANAASTGNFISIKPQDVPVYPTTPFPLAAE